jgi:protein-S-isoprenylcysteine O-methyltransferase Ste14
MKNELASQRTLGKAAWARLFLAFTVVAAMLFLSAGTVRYWEAWLYLAVVLVVSSLMVKHLLSHSPALLERRLRMREKEPRQRWIVGFVWLWLVATYLAPGFDRRWGGSEVPLLAVMIGELFVLLGYGVIFRVFKENPYASRIVEVEPDQKVVASGPYAVIRHPMYAGALLIALGTPVALGSYWGLLPAAFILPIVVARLRHEESVLARDLEGYRDYLRHTRYRLIPGLW